MAIVFDIPAWQKTVAVVLAIIVVVSFPIRSEEKIAFLDVGQGDAILIQDGNQQVLVDGGEGTLVLEQLSREMPWFDRVIELIVITHPQRDHMEGLLHVMERYDVGLVVMPRVVNDSLLQEELLNKLIKQNIPYRFGWAGQKMYIGDIQMSVLGPFDTTEAQALTRVDVNNASIITRINFHGISVLLTGDAEASAEALLVQNIPEHFLDVDILKAGHHGSRTSTTSQLLKATTPKIVAISVGKENTFGHPHPTVLNRLEGMPVIRTDEVGTIRFEYVQGEWRLHNE